MMTPHLTDPREIASPAMRRYHYIADLLGQVMPGTYESDYLEAIEEYLWQQVLNERSDNGD